MCSGKQAGGLCGCSASQQTPSAGFQTFLVGLQRTVTRDQTTKGPRNTNSIFTSEAGNYRRVHQEGAEERATDVICARAELVYIALPLKTNYCQTRQGLRYRHYELFKYQGGE